MKRARLDVGIQDGEWSGDSTDSGEQNEKVFQLKKVGQVKFGS